MFFHVNIYALRLCGAVISLNGLYKLNIYAYNLFIVDINSIFSNSIF